MRFEYDENKSVENRKKHGIDFIEAQKLWKKDDAVVIPAKLVEDEVRYALIFTLYDKCYVAIFTLRDGAYRIISVRRCRKKEEALYHEKNHGG